MLSVYQWKASKLIRHTKHGQRGIKVMYLIVVEAYDVWNEQMFFKSCTMYWYRKWTSRHTNDGHLDT